MTGLFLGADLGLLLGYDFAAPEAAPTIEEEELFGWTPIPWPKRKKIIAASFTIQERQEDYIEAKVKTAITASVIGASRRHEEGIYAHEKTKIAASIIEISSANMVILGMQDVFLKEIAKTERERKDIHDIFEIIMMDVI